jgi:hypothetical protein
MIQRLHPPPHPAAAKHLVHLQISSELTCIFRRMKKRNDAMITPQGVIDVLNRAGVKCVLMGTYGMTGWRSEPRATQDVDVLVRKKDIRKAVRALQTAYPDLTVTDFVVVTRFMDPATQMSVIDVMKPTQDVFRAVFRHTIPIGDTHEIPDLEMALVSKFAAMVSHNRLPEKKLIDAGDFTNIVRHNRNDIDLRKLKRLADKVYPSGGDEMLQLITDIDAGRTIRI